MAKKRLIELRVYPSVVAFLVVFGVFSPFLQAEEIQQGANYVLCRKGRAVRTVEVRQTKNECQVVYTKRGQGAVVASGEFREFCEKILVNVTKNLHGLGWLCTDKSQQAKIIREAEPRPLQVGDSGSNESEAVPPERSASVAPSRPEDTNGDSDGESPSTN